MSKKKRQRALAELRAELAEFSHDGLVQLREDLERQAVVRGTWQGCVISYKRGAPGSVCRDRMGRRRNVFTELWDSGFLLEEDVLREVEAELARRVGLPVAVPAAPETMESEAPIDA